MKKMIAFLLLNLMKKIAQIKNTKINYYLFLRALIRKKKEKEKKN